MLCSVRSLFASLAVVICGTVSQAAADTFKVVPDMNQRIVHEGDGGIFSFTVTDLVNGKVTIDKITTLALLENGKDPIAGGKDADEVFASSIVFDFCTGATLLNTNTCTFRDAFLTRDVTPDKDVDQANWFLGVTINYHFDSGVKGDQIETVDVGITDATPEPSTLSLGIVGGLAGVVLAYLRRRARTVHE